MANGLRWWFAGCKAVSIASFGIAACAFIGHLIGSPFLYRWGSSGIMSWPTATYAMLLSAVTFTLSSGLRAIEKYIREIPTAQTANSRTRKKLARS